MAEGSWSCFGFWWGGLFDGVDEGADAFSELNGISFQIEEVLFGEPLPLLEDFKERDRLEERASCDIKEMNKLIS